MKLAVMQPYFFPYIGYFQLIHAVDKFVFYDDVNYIKRGWINRNRILNQGKDLLFTVPLEDASQFLKINETYVHEKTYIPWQDKFFKTIEYSYKKAPYYNVTMDLMRKVFVIEGTATIGTLATNSVLTVCAYLNLQCDFVRSSTYYENSHLSGGKRLLDICQQEKAASYINPVGGQSLYDQQSFMAANVSLVFLKSLPISYRQFDKDYVPWLSIIDVLMFNSIEEIRDMINKYELI